MSQLHTEHPFTVEVAPGVHAYVQPDGGWCLNNAGWVTDGHTTLLVDTAATERRALMLREALVASGAPMPAHVVNTHHHGDHTYGNAVFAQGPGSSGTPRASPSRSRPGTSCTRSGRTWSTGRCRCFRRRSPTRTG